MAANMFASSVKVYFQVVEIGTVYAYVDLTWGVVVHLTGVPPLTLTDGLGNVHNAERAAPHISDPDEWINTTRFRFNSVPRYGPFLVVVPSGITGIQDGSGNTPAAHTYTATET